MFLLDYVKNKLTSSTDPTQINVDEVVTEDGFVMVLEVQRQKADQENFEPIEMPVIEPVEDAMMEVDRVVRISPTNEIETRRRKELIVARAKTAARKRLEKEFFADPESGKDVRFHKVAPKRGSKNSHSVATPRFFTQSVVQRSKISSGKSNDRKVHLEFDIFTFPSN